MAYEELRERGLVEDVKPDFAQVGLLLARADKDVVTARSTATIDRQWAYGIAYQAMLRATKALTLAEGIKPRGRDQARTLVLIAQSVLGAEGKALVNAFDRMRRKWQAFLDGAEVPLSRYETEAAIKDARRFLEKAQEITREQNPQLAQP